MAHNPQWQMVICNFAMLGQAAVIAKSVMRLTRGLAA